MLFGAERNNGIRFNGLTPEIVVIGENGVTEADVLRHDETRQNPNLAFALSRLDYPEFPVPIGVLRAVQKPTYNEIVEEQQAAALTRQGEGDLDELFNRADTWEVEDD
jgi:2-oxoglutarate ferredoxin oxidoreductase subunit beta